MQKYGLFHFFLDVFLTIATGGLWIIWILIRQFRRK